MAKKDSSEGKPIPDSQEPKKFFGMEITRGSAKKPRKSKPLIEVGVIPVANFLPVRLREAKYVEFVRRRLFALSVGTISACFLAFLGSSIISFSGDLMLADAQLRLSQVKAEQAKYADVQAIEQEILFQNSARIVATSTEINYRGLIRDLNQELPAGARFVSIQTLPYSETDQAAEGLANPYATKVSITMELRDFPSLQLFLNRIPKLKAFYDSKLSSVATIDNGISVSLVAFFSTDLYTRQYGEPIVVGDEVPGTVLDTPAPFPKPTPTPTPSPSPSAGGNG